MEVIRVGSFNLVSENGYLEFNDDGTISELLRQPDGKFLGTTSDMMSAGPGEVVDFGIDVTRGGILGLLVESPTIRDRIEQGGIVGYTIIALGIIGLLIAIMRFMALSTADRKVSAQLKRDTASTDNPLGRVLAAYESNRGADTETIELKLSEAALKEMPALTKGLLFIKVTAAVAPLMGSGGAIVNLSSQAGRDGGGPGAWAYAASKGAVMTLTRGWAKELGPRNIRVNALCPGMISTKFHDTFTQDQVRANVAAATPLRREGQATEIADAVSYLASDESSFIQGANIDINGGLFFS